MIALTVIAMPGADQRQPRPASADDPARQRAADRRHRRHRQHVRARRAAPSSRARPAGRACSAAGTRRGRRTPTPRSRSRRRTARCGRTGRRAAASRRRDLVPGEARPRRRRRPRSSAMITGEVQPRPGPSMIPYTSVASVTMTSSWPTGSNRRARGAFDSGTKSAVRTIAAMPTGMLTQKMLRQPTVLTSTPPTTGPSAMLRPTTPPQIPIALARSRRSVNVFVMIDIATGLSIDPPTACTIRNATSAPRLGARLHSSEPTREQRQAGLEGAPAADPVGRRPGEHQQAGDHQRVGSDDPLQARRRWRAARAGSTAARRSRP